MAPCGLIAVYNSVGAVMYLVFSLWWWVYGQPSACVMWWDVISQFQIFDFNVAIISCWKLCELLFKPRSGLFVFVILFLFLNFSQPYICVNLCSRKLLVLLNLCSWFKFGKVDMQTSPMLDASKQRVWANVLIKVLDNILMWFIWRQFKDIWVYLECLIEMKEQTNCVRFIDQVIRMWYKENIYINFSYMWIEQRGIPGI